MPPMRATDIFPDGRLIARQGGNEPLIAYGPRALYELPARAIQIGVNDAADALRMAGSTYFSTPNQQRAAAVAAQPKPAATAGWPERFDDPRWNEVEAYASKLTGVPQQLLASVRMNGERSNNSQVSKAGAKSVYQIIPQTAAGIKKNYGIDPLSSPQNAALGAAYVLREQAGNPGPQDWTPQRAAKAVGGYFGGAAGSANPFSQSIGDGGSTVGQYTQRVLRGDTKLSGAFVNPFDPTYANQALGQIDQAAALEKQPWSASSDAGPMPEPPKPEAVPKTDFSQSDADLQALRPQEVSIKEMNQIKKKNFWAGLGAAMSKMPEGAGVGDFFLRLGGGALQGKAAGMDEIQQKEDAYDNKLAKWQAALYEHDFQKAQVHEREAMADWQANQNWALTKYQQGLALWTKNATPQLIGNDVVYTSISPEGKTTVKGIPINSMVDANAAMKKAGVLTQMFGEQNQGNSQVTSVENQIQGQVAIAKAGAVLAGDASPDAKAAAAAFAPVQAASFAIEAGTVANVIGADQAEALNKDIQTQLIGRGLMPGTKEFADAASKMATRQLAMAALADPKTMEKLMTQSSAASLFENYGIAQDAKSSTQVTTDSRGRTTRRQTVTSNPFADATSGPYSDVGPYKRY